MSYWLRFDGGDANVIAFNQTARWRHNFSFPNILPHWQWKTTCGMRIKTWKSKICWEGPNGRGGGEKWRSGHVDGCKAEKKGGLRFMEATVGIEKFKSRFNNVKDRCLWGSFEQRQKDLWEGLLHNSQHHYCIHTGRWAKTAVAILRCKWKNTNKIYLTPYLLCFVHGA